MSNAMAAISLTVNGAQRVVETDPATPLARLPGSSFRRDACGRGPFVDSGADQRDFAPPASGIGRFHYRGTG